MGGRSPEVCYRFAREHRKVRHRRWILAEPFKQVEPLGSITLYQGDDQICLSCLGWAKGPCELLPRTANRSVGSRSQEFSAT